MLSSDFIRSNYLFDQRGLYENIQCMQTYTEMTVNYLAQTYFIV